MSELVNTPGDGERIGGQGTIERGQWYWVAAEEESWLGCVVRVGTNYVKLESVRQDGSYRHERVHFDRFHERLKREHEPEKVIGSKVRQHQDQVRRLMEQVRELTQRLGMPQGRLAQGAAESTSTEVAVVSSQVDVKAYGKALVVAKEKTLPELFKKIKEEHKALAGWLTAMTIPIEAETKVLEGVISEIDERIFNVSLYAGLTEELVVCCKGKRAAPTGKVRIMQRRLYMDEECLLNYKAGGMSFENLEQFDEWICEPANRDRIMPFEKCIVSMRVRRKIKERHSHNMLEAYINFNLGELEKKTFLYIRNGERVHRLSCVENFGPRLFPDRDAHLHERSMMVRKQFSRIEMISRNAYEVALTKFKETAKAYKAWAKEHPKQRSWDNPHRHDYEHNDWFRYTHNEWEPFDPSSVLYDDATEQITKEVNSYNRIVLIVQGLLDRSTVLHPHPPINLWNADHMGRYVELVYDGGGGLSSGPKPDFKTFRTWLNASATADSFFTGQQDLWEREMAKAENKRNANRYGHRTYVMERYRPYGNPGPGLVAKPQAMLSGDAAVFAWERPQLRSERLVRDRFRVSINALLNVSAYRPGMYLQFFRDHRTRAEYLHWAPLMLAAEDWHAKQETNHVPTDRL